jgi:hypothetical protein
VIILEWEKITWVSNNPSYDIKSFNFTFLKDCSSWKISKLIMTAIWGTGNQNILSLIISRQEKNKILRMNLLFFSSRIALEMGLLCNVNRVQIHEQTNY